MPGAAARRRRRCLRPVHTQQPLPPAYQRVVPPSMNPLCTVHPSTCPHTPPKHPPAHSNAQHAVLAKFKPLTGRCISEPPSIHSSSCSSCHCLHPSSRRRPEYCCRLLLSPTETQGPDRLSAPVHHPWCEPEEETTSTSQRPSNVVSRRGSAGSHVRPKTANFNQRACSEQSKLFGLSPQLVRLQTAGVISGIRSSPYNSQGPVDCRPSGHR